MTRVAECCCGECSVKVESDPLLYGICNCVNCKKRTGSAFGLSAYFKEDEFSVESGDLNSYKVSAESGNQERKFCSRCGTTLYWHTESLKGMVGVAGGCFISNPLPQPEYSAQDETRCRWITFDDGIKLGLSRDDIPDA